MPFVKEGTDPKLEKLYKEIHSTLGVTPNILRATSLDPDIANWFWDGVKIILLRESKISRILKESIAVAISSANSCKYCVNAHSAILQFLGLPENQIHDIQKGLFPTSPKDEAAIKFALKINGSAHQTTKEDHQMLLDLGYTEQQIVEIVSVVAAFRWANIIADSLGIELES